MWLGWGAILLALMFVGVLLIRPGGGSSQGRFNLRRSDGGPGRREGSEKDPDPLLVEFEREERVARERFERSYAAHPQCFFTEGQIRSD